MPTDLTNPQGLTPAQMSAAAMANAQRDTIQAAVNDPQVLKTGPQTGSTPTNGMIAPTDINFQAYNTAPKAPLNPVDPGKLTSASANQYVNDLGNTVANGQAKLSADEIASNQKLADLNTTLGQQSSNLIQNQIKAAEVLQKPIKEKFNDIRTQNTAARTEAEASQRVADFRGEVSGIPYSTAATTKREAEYTMQDKQLATQESDALNAAWDAGLRGEIGISQRLLGEASTAMAERQRIRDDKRAEQDRIQKLQEYEDNRAIKAEDRGQTTISNIAAAGLTTADVPASYLDALDTQMNKPKGYSQKLLETSTQERNAKTADDNVKSFKSVQEALKLVVPGEPVTINGNHYFGTQGTGTVEISKTDGHGRMAVVDQDTGKITLKDLGVMSGFDAGKWATVYKDGTMMKFNSTTGEYVPLVKSGGASGDAGWDQTISPEGSKGGQCGTFIHNFVEDYPSGINTVEARRGIVNVPKTEVPRIGDVLLQNYGSTGHSAMVNYVFQGQDGRTMVKLTESNFHGDERVMNTRTVPMDDPSVLGLFRGQLRPQAESGSDLPAIAGPTLPGQEFQPVPTGETAADRARNTDTSTTSSPSPFLDALSNFSGTPAAYDKLRVAGEAKEARSQRLADLLAKNPAYDFKGVPSDIVERATALVEERGQTQTPSMSGTYTPTEKNTLSRLGISTDSDAASFLTSPTDFQKWYQDQESSAKGKKLADIMTVQQTKDYWDKNIKDQTGTPATSKTISAKDKTDLIANITNGDSLADIINTYPEVDPAFIISLHTALTK